MLKANAIRNFVRQGLVGLAATATAASSMAVVSVATAPPAGAAVNCAARSGTTPDLTGCDLTGVDLSTASWTRPNLTDATLDGATIGNALKNGATIVRTSFNDADFRGAGGYDLVFTNASLDGIKVSSTTNFTRATFTGSHANNVDWSAMTKNAAGQATLGGTDTWYDQQLPTTTDHVTIAEAPGCATTQHCGVMFAPGMDVSGANLAGMDLSTANLYGIASGNPKTTGTPAKPNTRYKLVGGYFMGQRSNLAHANLTGLDLTGLDLSIANFSWVKSSGLKGTPKLAANCAIIGGILFGPGVDLSGANVAGLDLSNVSLSGVASGNLKGVPAALPAGIVLAKGYLIGPGAYLGFADLSGVNLMNVDLSNANLLQATITGATLFNTKFTGANVDGLVSGGIKLLPGATNVFTGLGVVVNGYVVGKNVNDAGADLSNTVVSNVDISNIDLTGAKLDGARWTGVAAPNGASVTLPDGYRLAGCKVGSGSTVTCLVGPKVNLAPQPALGANPYTQVITLTGALDGIDFTGANLTSVASTSVTSNGTATLPAGTKIIGGTLVGPGLSATGSDLSGADLTGVDMTGFTLANGKFQNYSSTTGLKLDNATFNGTDMTGTDLTGASKNGLRAYALAGTAPTVTTSGWIAVTASSKTTLVGPGANLMGVPLAGLDISGASLTGARTNAISSAASKLPTGYKAGACTTDVTAGGQCIFGPGVDLSGFTWMAGGWPTLNVSATGTVLDGVDLTGAKLDGFKATALSCASSPIFPTGVKCAPTAFGATAKVLVGPKLRLESGSLQGADLSGADMTGMTIIGTRTTGIAKAPATLPAGFVAVGPDNAITLVGPGALISAADLTGLDISAANLTGTITWDVSGGIKAPAKMPAGAKVFTLKNVPSPQMPGLLAAPGVKLSNVPANTDLTGANLTGANLAGATGPLNLSKANLTNASFGAAVISGWTFTGATVTGANFGSAVFGGNATTTGGLVGTPASLPAGVKLVKGYLAGPSLSLAKADLSKADLSGVKLLGADVTGAKLAGANLAGAATAQVIGTPASLPAKGWALLGDTLFGPYVNCVQYCSIPANTSLAGLDLTGTNLAYVNFGADLVPGPLAATPAVPLASHISAGRFMVGPGDNLSKADLSGVNLSYANLTGTDFTGATLDGTTLPNGLYNFTGVKLQGIKGTPLLPSGYVQVAGSVLGQALDLSGLNLSKMDLAKLKADKGVRFDNAILTKANLSGVKAAGVSFWGADLTGANLTGGDFTGADMSFSNVDGATLTNADWKDALVEKISSGGVKALPKNFPTGYKISGGYILGPRVKLDNEKLAGVDFSGVDLGDASFYNTNLAGAKTCGVKGSPSFDYGWVFTGTADTAGCIVGPYANLAGADLTGANLANANLLGVLSGGITGSPTLPSGYQLAGGYIFGENVDLSGAKLGGVTVPSVSFSGVTSGGITGTPTLLPAGVRIIGGFLVASYVNLSGEKLAKLSFKGLSLDGVKFSGADLSGADLSGATFSSNTLFDKAVMTGANVAGTDFSGAYVGRKASNDLATGAMKGTPKGLPGGITLVKGVFTG